MPSATQHPPSSSNPRNRRPGDPEQASRRWPRPSAPQPAPHNAPLEYQRGTGPLPPLPLPQPGVAQPPPSAGDHPRSIPAVPPQPPRATQPVCSSPPPSTPRRQTAAPAPQPSRAPQVPQMPQMPVVAAGATGPGLAATALAASRRNPRVRAAICYVLPFIPALSLLLRERRNGFIRMHASQAIAFFGLVAFLQIALFIALVAAGGLVTDLRTAAVFGLIFYALFFIAGALGLLLWLALLRDALAGRFRRYPAITGLARRVERLARRVQRLPA